MVAFVINTIDAALLAIGDLQLTMPQCDALGVTGTAVTVCTTVLIHCVMCFDRILPVAKPQAVHSLDGLPANSTLDSTHFSWLFLVHIKTNHTCMQIWIHG